MSNTATAQKIRKLQTISMFRKCQCNKEHGDNHKCRVLVAERALYAIDPKIAGAKQ